MTPDLPDLETDARARVVSARLESRNLEVRKGPMAKLEKVMKH